MTTGRLAADSLIRRVGALGDEVLRVGFLLDVLLRWPVADLAQALDSWCERAEQAEEGPRGALVSLVDALALPAAAEVLQRLREEAAGEALLALERLVRHPFGGPSRAPDPDPNEARVPDYGKGRPLTLGERKSLARRSDRTMIGRLLLDPHPDVIHRLLVNPRVVEDDVLRLATKRPCRSDVLAVVARSVRWAHRPIIRRALVMNPHTPVDVALSMAGLLLRQELLLVATSPEVHPAIRAVCRERLDRLPPSLGDGDKTGGDVPFH